jgi:hypothetical protein
MKNYSFRNSRFLATLGMTVLLLWPVVCVAQNGVTVGELSITPGSPSSVTFEVSWYRTEVLAEKVWVFVDYNNAGTMTRLLIDNAVVTGSGNVQTVYGNKQGAWVIAPEGNSFSTQVTMSFSSQDVTAGACA